MRWRDSSALCRSGRQLRPDLHSQHVCEACGRKLIGTLLEELLPRLLSVPGVELDLFTRRRIGKELRAFAAEKGLEND